MKSILMTGATGLIGNALGQKLVRAGHHVRIVSRNEKKAKQQLAFPAEIVVRDLNNMDLPASAFENIDCVIHLAGESIDGRWTDQKKKNILESRTLTTAHLLKNAPAELKTIISVSAQGFYGDCADEEIDENVSAGSGFLADVCQQWEKPFHQLCESSSNKTRIVILRLGVVLSHQGGALRKMLPLFQKNVGAALGNGKQWMSWIHIDDLCEVFLAAVNNVNYRGVFNVASDSPVMNREFTKKMCQELGVLQLPKVPSIALKILYGEMSEIILNSVKLIPKKLKGNDFKFQYADLDSALKKELADFKSGQALFTAQQYIPHDIEKVFSFFSKAENLESITPDILQFKIQNMSTKEIQQGSLINYTLKIHGVPAHWQTEIENWNPPHEFIDNQLKGPYKKWHHTHTFEKMGNGTLMSDYVRYQVPFGYLGQVVSGSLVQSDIETIFAHRRQVIADQKF